jgi:hypothetical protein
MWLLIWACLLLVAGVYLGARVWGLWGQTKELGSELASAERRIGEVQGQLVRLGERLGSKEQLAVFDDPSIARKRLDRARAAGRRARRQRRAVLRSSRGPST